MGWRKNIQREKENNNIPNATGKKKYSLGELAFSHLPFLYFPSSFEIANRSGYPNESLTACPKVNVIPLYRYLQDIGSVLISSLTCTVLASPAKHQNPAPLTKSSCPKELKCENSGNQMVPMIRRAQGKTGAGVISMVFNST